MSPAAVHMYLEVTSTPQSITRRTIFQMGNNEGIRGQVYCKSEHEIGIKAFHHSNYFLLSFLSKVVSLPQVSCFTMIKLNPYEFENNEHWELKNDEHFVRSKESFEGIPIPLHARLSNLRQGLHSFGFLDNTVSFPPMNTATTTSVSNTVKQQEQRQQQPIVQQQQQPLSPQPASITIHLPKLLPKTTSQHKIHLVEQPQQQQESVNHAFRNHVNKFTATNKQQRNDDAKWVDELIRVEQEISQVEQVLQELKQKRDALLHNL